MFQIYNNNFYLIECNLTSEGLISNQPRSGSILLTVGEAHGSDKSLNTPALKGIRVNLRVHL